MEISSHELSNGFANFFEKKVNDIVIHTKVNQNVYNGTQTIQAQCGMFMTRDNNRECVSEIKVKNTEGNDRIPQRVLVDGVEQLLESLTNSFKLIYSEKSIGTYKVKCKRLMLV